MNRIISYVRIDKYVACGIGTDEQIIVITVGDPIIDECVVMGRCLDVDTITLTIPDNIIDINKIVSKTKRNKRCYNQQELNIEKHTRVEFME